MIRLRNATELPRHQQNRQTALTSADCSHSAASCAVDILKHTTLANTNAAPGRLSSYSATLGISSTNQRSLVPAVLNQENCAVARCSSRSAMSHHRWVAFRRAAGSSNSPSPSKSAAMSDSNLHAARRCSCISSRLLSAALPHVFCFWTVNNAFHDYVRVPCGVEAGAVSMQSPRILSSDDCQTSQAAADALSDSSPR